MFKCGSGDQLEAVRSVMAVSMDELTASLDAHLDVAQNPYDTNRPHPHILAYAKLREKAREMGDQHKRRKEHLERQKNKRDKTVNELRRLLDSTDNSTSVDAKKIESKESQIKHEKMDVSYSTSSQWNFANQLMMSEWLVDVPPDLAENWFAKPCPKGRRMLVVAYQGLTKAYSKAGHLVACFKSLLPGGHSYPHKRSITMLDCIWNREMLTYYVLDILAWNNHVVLDSETEFRFYWLHAKLNEDPELQKHSERNKCAFIPLPYSECKREILIDLMGMYPLFPDGPAVDGVLFYHKETIYEHKVTPLVTWLKPFMVPDILGIKVADGYLAERPEGYQSQEIYIEEFTLHSQQRRDHFQKSRTKRGFKPSYKSKSRIESMDVNCVEGPKCSDMDVNDVIQEGGHGN